MQSAILGSPVKELCPRYFNLSRCDDTILLLQHLRHVVVLLHCPVLPAAPHTYSKALGNVEYEEKDAHRGQKQGRADYKSRYTLSP